MVKPSLLAGRLVGSQKPVRVIAQSLWWSKEIGFPAASVCACNTRKWRISVGFGNGETMSHSVPPSGNAITGWNCSRTYAPKVRSVCFSAPGLSPDPRSVQDAFGMVGIAPPAGLRAGLRSEGNAGWRLTDHAIAGAFQRFRQAR